VSDDDRPPKSTATVVAWVIALFLVVVFTLLAVGEILERLLD